MNVLADTHGIAAAPITPQMFASAGKEHMAKYGQSLSLIPILCILKPTFPLHLISSHRNNSRTYGKDSMEKSQTFSQQPVNISTTLNTACIVNA